MRNALIALAILYLIPGFAFAFLSDILDGQGRSLAEKARNTVVALFAWPGIVRAIWREVNK